MKRKPLEGIESLLFALGALAGYLLNSQGYVWWVVLIIVIVLSLAVDRLVIFLRRINKKVDQ